MNMLPNWRERQLILSGSKKMSSNKLKSIVDLCIKNEKWNELLLYLPLIEKESFFKSTVENIKQFSIDEGDVFIAKALNRIQNTISTSELSLIENKAKEKGKLSFLTSYEKEE